MLQGCQKNEEQENTKCLLLLINTYYTINMFVTMQCSVQCCLGIPDCFSVLSKNPGAYDFRKHES